MNIKDSMAIFIRNVRWRREQAGLSVAELAERSGLPLEMLEKLESGIIPKEMMVTDAILLARVFGCEEYQLFK